MGFNLELIRFYLGLFFIIYGIIFVAIEKINGITIYDSKDQINGVINGFVNMIVGVVVFSTSFKKGIITLIIVLLIWIIEKKLLSIYIDSKKAKYLNKSGTAVSTIKARHKGNAIIDGKQVKITAGYTDIIKDAEIVVTDFCGAKLIADNK